MTLKSHNDLVVLLLVVPAAFMDMRRVFFEFRNLVTDWTRISANIYCPCNGRGGHGWSNKQYHNDDKENQFKNAIGELATHSCPLLLSLLTSLRNRLLDNFLARLIIPRWHPIDEVSHPRRHFMVIFLGIFIRLLLAPSWVEW
jgi:hypothetical protein